MCPACNQQYESKAIHRFERNTLHDYTFKCTKCPANFKYLEADKHYQEHAPVEPIQCPLLCGKSIEGGKPEVSLHLCEECPKTLLTCPNCKGVDFRREEAIRHNCFSEKAVIYSHNETVKVIQHRFVTHVGYPKEAWSFRL